MVSAITTGITNAIKYVGQVFSAIFDAEGAWGPILAIIGLAIGFYVCRVGIRILKSLIKGY